MSITTASTLVTQLALLGIVFSLAEKAFAQPEGQYEAIAYGVNNYDSASEDLCCPNCSNLKHAGREAAYVHAAFLDIGYEQSERQRNKAVDGIDFWDSQLFPFGRDHVDPSGADFADVVFYHGHGSAYWGNNCWSLIFVGDWDPSVSHGYCVPRTDDHMRFGSSNSQTRVQGRDWRSYWSSLGEQDISVSLHNTNIIPSHSLPCIQPIQPLATQPRSPCPTP